MQEGNGMVVLCVDDDTTVLHALRILLNKQLGSDCVVEIAESGEEALEICEELHEQSRDVGVVISDYIMPGMLGDELLARVHATNPDAVKILLTGQSHIDGVKRAINEANLYRFLEKPFDNADIVLTTRGALRAFQQDKLLQRQNEELRRFNTELESMVAAKTAELLDKNRELERLAITDRLTGLYNRLKLDQILAEELALAQRYATPFALVLVDVDHFKAVNDQHGHQMGDAVLVEMAGLLHAHARATDAVGRWGGEEFLIVCRKTELDGGVAMAEKLRALIADHHFPGLGGKTASFGVSAFRSGDGIAAMVNRADQALYRAKAQGRDRVEKEA